MTISTRRLASWQVAKPVTSVARRIRVAWYFAQQVDGLPRRVLVIGRWAVRKVEERLVDGYYRRWGLATKGPDFDHHFDGTSDFVGYVPTPWRLLRTLFPPDGLGPDDVVLEYGSGQGRVMIWVASRFAVRRVIGVEHNADSITAARANLENWRGPLRCRAVEFFYDDAREFVVPDDVTVVYLFNPFVGETFARVLEQLGASLERRPRALRLIYLYPLMHDAVVESGFTVAGSHEDLFYPWTLFAITRSRPVGPAFGAG
jgi:hypothetical protein